MKKLFLLLAALPVFMLQSCDNDEKDDLTNGEKIGLSQTELEYTWRGGCDTLQTQGSDWYFSEITVDGKTETLTQEEQGTDFEKTVEWLNVKRKDKEIEIKITDRNTSATDERTFEIVLQSEAERESIIGKQNVMLDGDWDDVIGLSTREVSFGKDGGTVEVATQGEFWWMTDITLNGEVYAVDYGETSHVKDWVSASKIGTTLQIEVSPNDTGAERTFSIGLEAGNYFDRVEGVQAAE